MNLTKNNESQVVNCSRFLDTVKEQIKEQYGSQENYAARCFMSRKQLNRILNSEERLLVENMLKFANDLNINLNEFCKFN